MKLCLQTRMLASLAIAGLGLSCAGCSFVFSRGPGVDPDKVQPSTDLECTKHPVFPILDSAQALGNGINIGMAASETGIYKRNPISKEAIIGANVASLVLYGTSAVYGYITMSRCRRAHARQSELLDAPESVPLPGEHRRARAPESQPEAVGFVFGDSKEAASDACEEAGHKWSEDEGVPRCSGTPSVEFPGASAQLDFTDGRLSAIEVIVRPPDDPQGWANAFRDTEIALMRLYGRPAQRTFVVPEECRAPEQFLGCVAEGKVSGNASWAHPDGGSVTLSIAGSQPPSTIRVRFTSKTDR